MHVNVWAGDIWPGDISVTSLRKAVIGESAILQEWYTAPNWPNSIAEDQIASITPTTTYLDLLLNI